MHLRAQGGSECECRQMERSGQRLDQAFGGEKVRRAAGQHGGNTARLSVLAWPVAERKHFADFKQAHVGLPLTQIAGQSVQQVRDQRLTQAGQLGGQGLTNVYALPCCVRIVKRRRCGERMGQGFGQAEADQ